MIINVMPDRRFIQNLKFTIWQSNTEKKLHQQSKISQLSHLRFDIVHHGDRHNFQLLILVRNVLLLVPYIGNKLRKFMLNIVTL